MSLKLGTGLGVLAFVLVASFYLNDTINSESGLMPKVSGSRSLASLQSGSETPNIISKSLVTKLAQTESLNKAQKAQRPSLFDKFAFEELQGRYSVEMRSGKIRAFRFDSQTNADPLAVPRPIEFLQSYKGLWSINFESISKVDNSNSNKEIFELKDKKNQLVGSVIFEKDSNGLWQGLEFIQK